MGYLPMVGPIADVKEYFTPVVERNRVNIIHHKCWKENGVAHINIFGKWLIKNSSSDFDGLPNNQRIYDSSHSYVTFVGLPRPWDDTISPYSLYSPFVLISSMSYKDPSTNRSVADWISAAVVPRGNTAPNYGEISFMFSKEYDGTTKDYFIYVYGSYPIKEA